VLALLLAVLPGSAQLPALTMQEPPEAGASDATQEPLEAPGEPRAIAGVASISCLSRLEFPGVPDQPHRLEASYVFPDRARWRISPAAPEPPEAGEPGTPRSRPEVRRLRYRWGTGLWEIEPGEQASRRFRAEELRLALLQTELRRVALIWPAELQWSGEGDLRCATLAGVGTFLARLDSEGGRPVELESRDFDGTVRERLEAISWRVEGEHTWPVRWNLVADGNLIWHETIESVKTGRKLLDAYFLPVDRRAGRVPVRAALNEIEEIDVPRCRALRSSLCGEPRGNWDKAIEFGVLELAKWRSTLEGTKYVLDDRLHFYVDGDCKPIQLEIRLRSGLDAYSPEWVLQGGCRAVRSVFAGVGGLSAQQLRRLASSFPKNLQPGPPYVVVQVTDAGAGLTQLVLPEKARE
jgi:hypothetical protein